MGPPIWSPSNQAAEKSLGGEYALCPYRKRTHVGEASSLRCASDLWRRNSAKCPRNFGRRGAPGTDWSLALQEGGGPQRIGSSDCLAKTQVSAKSRKTTYRH